MKDTLLIKNISVAVSCDKSDTVYKNCDILAEDGIITAIGSGVEADGCARIISGAHMAAYPGLVNTHHHMYQLFSRNLPEVQNMELFPWLKALYGIWKELDGEVVRYSSLSSLGVLMKNGCTTCFDHHYVFPKNAHGLIGEQFRAANELGIRLYASRGSMDLSEKDGGLPPDSVVQTIDEILRDSERSIDEFNDTSIGSYRNIALAPCSPFSVSGELMKESALLARAKGARLHTHLAETLDEERFTLSKFSMRPYDYAESLGFAGSDVWYAHGIYLNEDELKRMAENGTGVAHCPISNMKLSSGVANVPYMLSSGVKVGLAVDGSASNDGSNLLEELRVGYLVHRLTYGAHAPSAYDMLKIATAGGASVLGRSDIGSLEIGKCCDLFMVDTRRLELTGAMFDPMSVLATVGLKGAVDSTIVGGHVTVERGRLVNVDEERLSRDADACVKKYLKRA